MIQERNFLVMLLLSIVTCGIYAIYFWYQYTNDVNRVCDGDGEHTTNYIVAILLGIITCGIYTFYWYYKLGNRLANNAPRYGKQLQENGTTILLWVVLGSFLLGIGAWIGMYLLIKNMNTLAAEYNAGSIRMQ